MDKYLRRKKWLYCCFIDFRAAFDTLFRKALIFKLLQRNIGGSFLRTIQSMYSSIEYCVKIGNQVSDKFSSGVGVKQGCVLSPLLSNLFVRDLPSSITVYCDPVELWNEQMNCLQFADDLVVMSQSALGLQNALRQLENYCSQ